MGFLSCWNRSGEAEDPGLETIKKEIKLVTLTINTAHVGLGNANDQLRKLDTVTKQDGLSALNESPASDEPLQPTDVAEGKMEPFVEHFLLELSKFNSQKQDFFKLFKSKLGVTISDPSEIIPTFPKDKQPTHGKVDQQSLLAKIRTLEDELSERDKEIEAFKTEIINVTKERDDFEKKLIKTQEDLSKAQEKLFKVQGQLDEANQKLEQIFQMRICVMSINQHKLEPIVAAVRQMQVTRRIPTNYQIIEKKITGSLSISKDDFEDSKRVILVGISEPRNMLISDSEPSQLGAAYREAKNLCKDVLIVYVDTKYEDSLKDNQPYHASLATLLENQAAIGEMAKNNRFISVKCKEKESVQKLNQAQCDLISNWLQK